MGRSFRRRSGFTLLEIIVALSILATVLTLSYQILTNVLDTERHLSRLATPEKIGQGMLSMLRRDLLGTVWKGLGERVFQVIDRGEMPFAQDELQFFTTQSPMSSFEELSGQTDLRALGAGATGLGELGYGGVTAVAYYLKENPDASRQARVYTLFRKEILDFQGGGVDPFQAPGVSYEVYDKVRSLSVEVFDGYEWRIAWDSHENLAYEAELEAAESNANGVATVAGTSKPSTEARPATAQVGGAAAATDPNAAAQTEEEQIVQPPAAVPVAVRVTVSYLAGDEKGAYVVSGSTTGEFQEYSTSTIVPILTSLRIALENPEEESTDATMDPAAGDSETGERSPSGANNPAAAGGTAGTSSRSGRSASSGSTPTPAPRSGR